MCFSTTALSAAIASRALTGIPTPKYLAVQFSTGAAISLIKFLLSFPTLLRTSVGKTTSVCGCTQPMQTMPKSPSRLLPVCRLHSSTPTWPLRASQSFMSWVRRERLSAIGIQRPNPPSPIFQQFSPCIPAMEVFPQLISTLCNRLHFMLRSLTFYTIKFQ